MSESIYFSPDPLKVIHAAGEGHCLFQSRNWNEPKFTIFREIKEMKMKGLKMILEICERRQICLHLRGLASLIDRGLLLINPQLPVLSFENAKYTDFMYSYHQQF